MSAPPAGNSDCINLYGRGLDRLEADALRGTCHADAVDKHSSFTRTIDEFAPFAIECESTFAQTHHSVSSHNCEIDEDTAQAESYVHFFVLMCDRPIIGAGGGRYIDRLEKQNGKWASAVRSLIMDWTCEIPSPDWFGADWAKQPPRRDRKDFAYHRPLETPETN